MDTSNCIAVLTSKVFNSSYEDKIFNWIYIPSSKHYKSERIIIGFVVSGVVHIPISQQLLVPTPVI